MADSDDGWQTGGNIYSESDDDNLDFSELYRQAKRRRVASAAINDDDDDTRKSFMLQFVQI